MSTPRFTIQSQSLELKTKKSFEVIDLTPLIQAEIKQSRILQGQALVTVQHTTTAIAINENEERLWQDIQTFFNRLVPESDRYLHNDLHLRDVPENEPVNAHSHLIAMLLNTSEAIPIQNGFLKLGTYQSILFLELDGPRTRTVFCQMSGLQHTQ